MNEKLKNDISGLDDIGLLVNAFYSEVRNDTLLGPIFDRVIKDNWPTHIDRMIRFWEAVLLEGHRYSGHPFAPHAKLPIEQTHFERWLKLFGQTIDRNFEGPKAEEARWRASRMATLFENKLEYIRQHPEKSVLR